MVNKCDLFAELFSISKQTHSLFESCLSQNPFILPFITITFVIRFGAKVCTFAPTLILVKSTGVKSMQWKQKPGACIKPGLVRRPLRHKVNLPSCVARRPLCHKVNVTLQGKRGLNSKAFQGRLCLRRKQFQMGFKLLETCLKQFHIV